MSSWGQKVVRQAVKLIFLALVLLVLTWVDHTWWALLWLPFIAVCFLFVSAMIESSPPTNRAAAKEEPRRAPPFRKGTAPLAVLQRAQDEPLRDPDTGEDVPIELLPPLSPDESGWAGAPTEIRELLTVTRGIEVGSERILFTPELAFEAEDMFPGGAAVMPDDAGNFWVVDIHPETGSWGPVYFVCHDPPTIAYGFSSLAELIHNVLNLYRRGVKRHRVHEVAQLASIMKEMPTVGDARANADSVLTAALEDASDDALVADLRDPSRRAEFDWGVHGDGTVIHRPGPEPIWILSREIP